MRRLRPVAEAENRLARFNGERDRIVGEVERRIVQRYLARAESGGEASLEYVLNDVAYCEIRRYESQGGKAAQKKAHRWRELAGRLGSMSEEEKRDRLRALVHDNALDVVGNFNTKVYRFSTNVLPPALSFLFSPVQSIREGVNALGRLGDQIQIEGPVEQIRAAADRGTLVVTPTHSSNLDSIAVGFGLMRSGLPPMTYGAGKNLFTNPFISFFMRNLGAYRVDRRLRFGLYKEILKEYSCVLLENGYHSLFFPGGTRSRSNMVESKLKLGLLGTAIRAYQNAARTGARYRRIYIVPLTINYKLVLEAETLIEDYLAERGKSRYIIEDDEFSRIGRIVEFLRKMLSHDGALVLRFGTPLDPFGNLTDEAGESLDPRGRSVDPISFVQGRGGEIAQDPQRDAEYTRALGRMLARTYREQTVHLSTTLVARAIFDAVASQIGTRDVYRLLRFRGDQTAVEAEDVLDRIARLVQRLRENPAWGSIHAPIAAVAPSAILEDGLGALGAYHTRPVAVRTGDRIRIQYMKLLYYYRNRTAHIPDAGEAMS